VPERKINCDKTEIIIATGMFLVNYFFYIPLLLVVWQCITCHAVAFATAQSQY
jgi:hypothetical protein